MIITPMVCITGAATGIGRALALRYAQSGANLLLISRNAEKLSQTVALCEQQAPHGIRVESILQDLSASDAVPKVLATIAENQWQIGVLINNAGLGCHKTFTGMDETEIQALLMVNITNLVKLTRGLLPEILQNRPGTIINIASVYAYTFVTNQVVYAATKAFVKSFSLGLAQELKGQGISVTCVCPGTTTQTQFRERMGLAVNASWCSATADALALKIIWAATHKKLIYTPFWYNKVFVFIVTCLPSELLSYILKTMVYRIRKFKPILPDKN